MNIPAPRFFVEHKHPRLEKEDASDPVPERIGFDRAGFLHGWIFSLFISVAIVVLAVLPPFVSEGARSFLMELFSGVCHQLPSRSPHIDGIPFAVCHRCFGAYAGLPAAALLFGTCKGAWPFSARSAPLFLLVAVTPASLDWAVGVVGIWENTPVSRVLTGLIMGTAGGYFLTAALVDSFTAKARTKQLGGE